MAPDTNWLAKYRPALTLAYRVLVILTTSLHFLIETCVPK